MTIDFSSTVNAKIPGNRADKDWAKALTAVDAKAANGSHYEGEWAAVGATIDLPPGTVLVIVLNSNHKRRGIGFSSASIRLVLPNGGLRTIKRSTTNGWAQELRKTAREWLALSPIERLRRHCEQRIAEAPAERQALEKEWAEFSDVYKKTKYKEERPNAADDEWRTVTALPSAVAEFDARVARCTAWLADLAVPAAPEPDARHRAIARIRAMMAEHGLTADDLR